MAMVTSSKRMEGGTMDNGTKERDMGMAI